MSSFEINEDYMGYCKTCNKRNNKQCCCCDKWLCSNCDDINGCDGKIILSCYKFYKKCRSTFGKFEIFYVPSKYNYIMNNNNSKFKLEYCGAVRCNKCTGTNSHNYQSNGLQCCCDKCDKCEISENNNNQFKILNLNDLKLLFSDLITNFKNLKLSTEEPKI